MALVGGTQGNNLRDAITHYERRRQAAESDPSSENAKSCKTAWDKVNTRYREYGDSMSARGHNYDDLDKILSDYNSQRP